MPELPAEARLVPWATDDAVVSAHRWSAARWLGSIWPFWVAVGFWAALVVSVVIDPPRHLTPPKLAALTAGILAIILVLFGFVLYMAAWRLLHRTAELYVFPEGYVFRLPRLGWCASRWDRVDEVRRAETVHHGVTTRSHVTVRATVEGELLFHDLLIDRSLNDYSALADDVEQRVARGQLPELLQEYRAGERLSFGPFALDSQGIYLRDRAFPWAEVKGVKITDGALVVVGPPVDIWKGNGVRLRDVPNLAALLALLNVNPWASLKPGGG